MATVDEIEELARGLSSQEKAALSRRLAIETGGFFPGISSTPGVCGGNACIAGTRIPVWILEAYRRDGATIKYLLKSYPSITEQDVVVAWAYAQRFKDEIDRQIAEQEDESLDAD